MIESEHSKDCKWHKDWHACDCGLLDIEDKSTLTTLYKAAIEVLKEIKNVKP